MQANLATALSYLLENEGPELNVSAGEPGGASKYGISLTVLSEWRAAHSLGRATLADVEAVTPELAGEIYTARYAVPMRFGELPSGVDYRALDVAANLGAHGGAMALQVALGMWPLTGVVDDATMAKVRATDPQVLIATLSGVWLGKKTESVSWPRLGHGLTNRARQSTARALALAASSLSLQSKP